jgi:hypothetical protein
VRSLDAERREDVGGSEPAGELERLTIELNSQAGRPDHADVFERAVPLAPLDEVRRRDDASCLIPAGFVDRDDAVRIPIGKRLQHDPADDAEDGGSGADAKRQGDQRGNGEPRCPRKRAERKAEITCEVADHEGLDERSLARVGRSC